MTIVLVVDVFDQLTNGTTMTAYRFAQMLRRCGHTVRVVSTGNEDKEIRCRRKILAGRNQPCP